MSKSVEYVTDSAALAALTSPFWLDALRQASAVAGVLVPILGAIWLIVQIVHKLRHWNQR